jgi:cobalt-zinc-cadmium efflux system protein
MAARPAAANPTAMNERHDHADRGHAHEGHAHHGHAHHGHVHHGHAHGAPASFGRAFAIGIALNLTFVAVEAGFGFFGNSVALLADAGHNLSDVLALVAAWTASILARRAPTPRFTYGLSKSSILAALFNAVLLLVAIGGIAWEAIRRLAHPEPVAGGLVMIVAGIGIVINSATAMLFASGRKGDLNIRGAYLHMVADAAVSAGVVVAGLLIMLTGRLWLDPVVSLVIMVLIAWGTWRLLEESLSLSLAAVPTGIDAAAVKAKLARLPGVAGLHDLHIWPVSTTETALTCHLLMPAGHPGDAFLERTSAAMKSQFGIGHVTIQIETSEASACRLAASGCGPV